FFLLLIRPPPSSTLFPSTTLFRSVRTAGQSRSDRSKDRPLAYLSLRLGGLSQALWRAHDAGGAEEPSHHQAECPAARRHRICAQDRKSTRLNSSHDQISYAVFCLK